MFEGSLFRLTSIAVRVCVTADLHLKRTKLVSDLDDYTEIQMSSRFFWFHSVCLKKRKQTKKKNLRQCSGFVLC